MILWVMFILACLGVLIWFRRNRPLGQATRRRRQEPQWDKKFENSPLFNLTSPLDSDVLLPPVKEKSGPKVESEKTAYSASSTHAPVFISLHVVAPKDQPYIGYELLQALLSNGFRYGENKIFHRHETKTGRGKILFNLVSLNKPGTFEVSKMGEFSCPGLTLFMLLHEVEDAAFVFSLMLETAEQLILDLGGEIWDDTHQPLTQNRILELQTWINSLENKKCIPDLFEPLSKH